MPISPKETEVLLTAGQSTLGRYEISLAASTVMGISISDDFNVPKTVYRYILHPGDTCKATIPTPPVTSVFKKVYWEN